ncbi:MAG: DUF1501 domain-containing protein [Pseudomonadota bacterium]
MTLTRRALLKSAAALGAGSAFTMGAGGVLPGFGTAHAANTSGYKAMVCLFFLGGLDHNDVLLPYDQSSYDSYADIRSSLLGSFSTEASRARGNLLPLAPDNSGDFGARQFALAPELSGLHGMFQSGRAAIVSNVGPLIQPVTREDVEDESAALPAGLFSHNDQQSQWSAGAPEGARNGWGGRMADEILASGSNQTADFTAISTLGNDVFLTGDVTQPYLVGLDGARSLDILDFYGYNPFGQDDNPTLAALRTHFENRMNTPDSLIGRDMAAAISGGLAKNEAFNSALETSQPLQTQFPPGFLGAQLRAIARTISTRNSLLMNRQVFYAAVGGFDTHSAQAQDLPRLLREIDQAVVAFYGAMEELGIANDVTLFTASEFGRTLAINGDGTDHGWGGVQFVVGGGVRGGRIYGDVPEFVLGHDQDVGSGRLLPSMSVEQFAAPIGRWFGLTEDELVRALPALPNFEAGSTPSFFV